MKVKIESRRQKEGGSQGKDQGLRVIVRHSESLGEGRVHGLAGIKHGYNSCDLLRTNPSSREC